jgi:tRNA(adenine34) deaminase
MFQNDFMQLALRQAEKAMSLNEVPVGAIVVERKTSRILSSQYNQTEKKKLPIYHAEILALTEASEKLNTKFLSGCDLYVTLEPCPLCAAAISMFRIGRLFYAACDPKFGAVESVSNFFASSNCLFRPELYSGICARESTKLMQDFFKSLRRRDTKSSD